MSSRESTLAKQLKFLASFGESGAIDRIDESIRNGWKGLFAPKAGSNATGVATATWEGPMMFAEKYRNQEEGS